jgi:hypothetical protein
MPARRYDWDGRAKDLTLMISVGKSRSEPTALGPNAVLFPNLTFGELGVSPIR